MADLALHVARALHAAMPPEARDALTPEALAADLGAPPKRELGDYAFPCFKLAKPLRSAPPKIAAALAEALAPRIASGEAAPISRVTQAGPYLNLALDLGQAAALVLPRWAAGQAPVVEAKPTKVMVEYSQPNTHKAFHVGHLRNVCLGDALVRLYRANGYEVVAANYLGDVGTHIAKCLWAWLDLLDESERKAIADAPTSERGERLGEVYTRATMALGDLEAAAKAGDAAKQAELDKVRARMTDVLKRIESREPEMTALWQTTRKWSLDAFDEIYDWCDVHFDRVFYESEVDTPGLELVQEFLDKGVFHESEGAVGIENPEVKHMPFFMLRKRDGTGLYSTKDLALARMKFDEYAIDKSIYVVDVRQSDHFRHVFLTLQKMGFEQAAACEHVPYEMVVLPEGAMSSRKGSVVLFRALREQLHAALREGFLKVYEDTWSEEELDSAAHEVALGAIKYGMLARDVNQKIVFDMDAWLEFTGATGPYLQYVAARTNSIQERASAADKALSTDTLENPDEACAALGNERERELVMAIAGLPAAVSAAGESSRPSTLCTYLYNLAKAYNRFQDSRDCKVIDSEGDLLQGRLMLVKATREALAWGLDLLGIPAPERM